MRKLLLYLLLVVPTSVPGALRETPEELAARYGKPIEIIGHPKSGGLYTYRWNNFEIVVNVVEGKSRSERYSHQNDAPLTAAEIRRMLDSNALGSVWRKARKTSEACWTLANLKAFADYPEVGGVHELRVDSCPTSCDQPRLSEDEVIRLADAEARRSKIDLQKWNRPEVHYHLFSDDAWWLHYRRKGIKGRPKFSDIFSAKVYDKTSKVTVITTD